MTQSLSLTAGLKPPRRARYAKHYTHYIALRIRVLSSTAANTLPVDRETHVDGSSSTPPTHRRVRVSRYPPADACREPKTEGAETRTTRAMQESGTDHRPVHRLLRAIRLRSHGLRDSFYFDQSPSECQLSKVPCSRIGKLQSPEFRKPTMTFCTNAALVRHHIPRQTLQTANIPANALITGLRCICTEISRNTRISAQKTNELCTEYEIFIAQCLFGVS